MRYFIGYLTPKEVSDWREGLIKEISKKFNIYPTRNTPSHVTLYRPFEVDDIEPVKSVLQKRLSQYRSADNLKVKDFGFFDQKVVFAKVDAEPLVESFVLALRQELGALLKMEQDFPIWRPHLTLANYLSGEDFKKVWSYVSSLKKPNFTMLFNNICLFRLVEDEPRGYWVKEKILSI